MNITEKRRSALINICYFAVLITGFFLFMKYAFWLFSPFLFAGMIAMILQKPVNAVSEKTRIKKGFVSALFVFAFIVIVISAVALVGYRLVAEFRDFAGFVTAKLNDLPGLITTIESWLLNIVSVLPASFEETARAAISGVVDRILLSVENGESAATIASMLGFSFSDISDKLSDSSINISSIASPILSTAKRIPSLVITIVIFFIACFFFTTDYDEISGLIKKSLKRETAHKLSAAKRITLSSMAKMVKSYITIIFITFCELFVGLNILKFAGFYSGDYIVIISLCTALLDILPIFGTGTIMLPWALYSLLLSQQYGLGIGLLVIYALITVIRQILEPKLVASNLGVHPILTLMGMYLGLELFGFFGVFILPLVIVLIKLLNEDGIIHLWGEDREVAKESTRPDPEPIIKPVVKKITGAVKATTSAKVHHKNKK